MMQQYFEIYNRSNLWVKLSTYCPVFIHINVLHQLNVIVIIIAFLHFKLKYWLMSILMSHVDKKRNILDKKYLNDIEIFFKKLSTTSDLWFNNW